MQGGAVYTLDPHTLNTIGLTHTDLKNFALQLSAEGKTLYVSNSLDGGISAIDTATGKVKTACCSASAMKRSPLWGPPAAVAEQYSLRWCGRRPGANLGG